MQYSEDQVHDLLLLRRLFYGRQGQLDRQRKALVSELSSGEAVMTDDPPLSNYSAITSLAHELQANAAEGHCLRVQCCCACFRGVSGCIRNGIVAFCDEPPTALSMLSCAKHHCCIIHDVHVQHRCGGM